MTAVRAGALIAGKYLLTQPLARGGMGAVWLAQHKDLDVAVAVKFMDQSMIASEDARARFEREAKAAAKLDTKHVVHVLDYGIDGGTPYIVMELLKGEDLAARLRRERCLPPVVAAGILGQVAKGLKKAHEAGLVHRDLKPANIFLAQKDDEEVAKILDFGIAKAIGTGLAGQATASGVVIGSVHYMSPEQARHAKSVDARSDLWSLGVIAFRMVTGRLPFPGEEVGDVLVKVCVDPVPRASEVAPGLPAAVDAFFARALARNMNERFQSASEMVEAFGAAAGLSSSLPPTMGSLPEIGYASQEAATPESVATSQIMQSTAAVEAASGTGTLKPAQVSQSVTGRRSWIGLLTVGMLIATVMLTGVLVVLRQTRPAPAAPATTPSPVATVDVPAPSAPTLSATAPPAAASSSVPSPPPQAGPAPSTRPAPPARQAPQPRPPKAEKKINLP